MATLIGVLLWIAFIFFSGLVWWKIMKKTGYHPALGFLMLFPVANLVMPVILAFRKWPIEKEMKEGAKPTRMPTPMVVLVIIMATIPMWFLVAAIAIPNFLRARLSVNESVAGTTIKTISAAIDTYAKAHNGQYPSSESALQLAEPYNNKTINGYTYSLSLSSGGYEATAKPAECGSTGVKIFKAKPGAAVSVENCK